MKKSRPTIVIMLMAFTAFVADSGCHKKVASAPATAPPPQAAPASPPAAPSAPATASRNTEAPAPAPAPSLDQLFRQNVKDAFFDYNKSDIRQDAKQALVADAEFLRAHPQVRFVIEGHCDERGSEEYNLGLGDRRATAAKRYLVNLGIPDSRIQTTSFGKEHPFCTEHDESCWQQNRRGHMTMTP
jgi:peptidoglycan-associated lipoprotein